MTGQDNSYLILDTSGRSFHVCVVRNDVVNAASSRNGSTTRSLPELVSEALLAAKLGFDGLCGICVSSGPGSFTGLRVGLSFAKAAALARKIPLLGISSFEQAMFSREFKRLEPVDLLLLHMKAESYYAYPPGGSFDPGRIRVASFSEITQSPVSEAPGFPGAPGESRYCFVDSPVPESFLAISGGPVRFAAVSLDMADLARLAGERFERNQAGDWRDMEPLYVQRSNAEMNFDARQRKQTDDG